MDFELTDTQREYRDRARTVAQEQLAPDYQARERRGRIDPELRGEIGRLGLIGPELPTEVGGRGLDRLTAGVVTEEIGRGDINVAYCRSWARWSARSSRGTPLPRSRRSGCLASAPARRSSASG